MTATGRGAQRQPDDFYETQPWVVRAILPHLTPGPVIDPFCGRGSILNVVRREWGFPTFGIEIDADRATVAAAGPHAVERGDAFGAARWTNEPASTVTNPPYSRAMEAILRAAAESPRHERAFLLRIGFIGSQTRAAFHRTHPADVFVLPRRPEFVASIKCKAQRANGQSRGCGWAVVQMLDEPRPKSCPNCGATSLQISTTDSTEYGWFVWGPGRGGRWSILDVDVPVAPAGAGGDAP